MIIDEVKKKLKKSPPKKILLPESADERILLAKKILDKEGLVRAELVVGFPPDESAVSYAAGLLAEGKADGLVAGAVTTTAEVIRAGLRRVGLASGMKTASSSFIISLPEKKFGEDGVLVFADCAVVPNPTGEQLADIAISAAGLAREVLGVIPRVAMLSYSTKGSASGTMVDKVREATELVRGRRPDILVDGEIQLDAAIIPDIAKRKKADRILGGRANVLIFPDLQSGNISYKLAERLASATAIGPLIQGLRKPMSDLSRGCGVSDIVNAVYVTASRD